MELNQLKPEVRKILENLKLGEMSDVYKDDSGSHLFLVQGREKGSQMSLDQAKDQIRQLLYEKQFQDQYQIWLKRLKAKSYINIRL